MTKFDTLFKARTMAGPELFREADIKNRRVQNQHPKYSIYARQVKTTDNEVIPADC
jgi:hypothetical protein